MTEGKRHKKSFLGGTRIIGGPLRLSDFDAAAPSRLTPGAQRRRSLEQGPIPLSQRSGMNLKGDHHINPNQEDGPV